jgi:glycosyltransferase involved in cell wall biosynthesis
MTMDALSVVIPTYNRAAVLKKALEAYRGQFAPQLIHELIVVDDGSTDGTETMVCESIRESPFPVRYLRQSNKGPAAARNYGIKEARSRLILFTDSDIVPDRDFVSQHAEWHRENPQTSAAVLGYVTWPADPKPTPFMRWYGEEGPLFTYGKFQNQREVSFSNLYTCNVSLKADFLRTCGLFDEEFKSAAYEDTELGYRLFRAGLKLLYNPNAIAYHYQYFLFADACRRAESNRTAAGLFYRKEAGQYALEQQKAQKSRVSYRIARTLGTGVGAALAPGTRWMDSHVRLPSIYYRLMYWYHVTRVAEYSESAVDPIANKDSDT